MRKLIYIFPIILMSACSDIVPEINPVDNSPVSSDKIYCIGTPQPAGDGTLWSPGDLSFFSMKSDTIQRYPISGYYGEPSYSIYKSGVAFLENIDSDNGGTKILSILQNSELTHYEFPFYSQYHIYTMVNLDDFVCIAKINNTGYNFDPIPTTVYTFDRIKWTQKVFSPVTSDYSSDYYFNSRYNFIIKSATASNLEVYNANTNIEKSYQYQFTDGYIQNLYFSDYCIDTKGNTYTLLTKNKLVTFDFESSSYTSQDIVIPGYRNFSFEDLFVDKKDQVWLCGTGHLEGYSMDNYENKRYLIYNLNTGALTILEKELTESYPTMRVFVDSRENEWYISKNNNSNEWKAMSYYNGTLKNERELDGYELFNITEDDSKKFWITTSISNYDGWGYSTNYYYVVTFQNNETYKDFNNDILYEDGNGNYSYPPGY